MIQFIYPGRLFFLSPRLRSAIMKIQAVIFLFNSSALLNQAYSLRILPAYEAREHFNACKCWIIFFLILFFLPSQKHSLESSIHGVSSFKSFHCSPPPNKSTIVLSSSTTFSSNLFSAELSCNTGGCRTHSSSLSLSGKRLSLSTDLR